MASIEPFIHRKVVALHQDASTTQAARAMRDHRIGCVMVADHQGHLVGVVTDRDLICRSDLFPPAPEQPLFEVMTRNLVTIDEYAQIDDVAKLMETYGIRRIPVVRRKPSGQERCVGIVTLDDLIASRSIDHLRLARIVQSQIFKGRSAIFGKTESIRARARAATRAAETLRHFYRVVSEKTHIPQGRVEAVSKAILTDLVQRLTYTAAVHFISQLPRGLQDELADLPAGPDRTITVDSTVLELSRRFGFEQARAKDVLGKFWKALTELLPPAALNHFLDQLPLDFYELFFAVRFDVSDTDVAA